MNYEFSSQQHTIHEQAAVGNCKHSSELHVSDSANKVNKELERLRIHMRKIKYAKVEKILNHLLVDLHMNFDTFSPLIHLPGNKSRICMLRLQRTKSPSRPREQLAVSTTESRKNQRWRD